jgi:hypothetical protein
VEPEHTASTGEWVSVEEAARHLQVAAATVRRRLKRGQLQGRQVSRPYGFTWEIWIDAVYTEAPPSTPRIDSDRDSLILQLTTQNVQLAGRVGWLESQLQQSQEQVRQLQAPVVETLHPSPAQRPWWAFWAKPALNT